MTKHFQKACGWRLSLPRSPHQAAQAVALEAKRLEEASRPVAWPLGRLWRCGSSVDKDPSTHPLLNMSFPILEWYIGRYWMILIGRRSLTIWRCFHAVQSLGPMVIWIGWTALGQLGLQLLLWKAGHVRMRKAMAQKSLKNPRRPLVKSRNMKRWTCGRAPIHWGR